MPFPRLEFGGGTGTFAPELDSDHSWAPIREFSADKRGRRFPWEIVAALVVVVGLLGWFLVPRYREMKRAAQEKVILDHVFKYLSGADQFFRANPGRLFVRHNELVGPGRTVPADFGPEAGEDYGILFPLRRDLSRLAVKTADGRSLVWFTHYDPDGKPWRDSVSQRADGELTGVAEMIKAYHELLARESRDGAQPKQFSDGSRFETTYRGGVPHGLFKAWFPDGKPWGEANYENGRVTGPCWNYSRTGLRFDELSPADLTQPLKTVL